jgi:hypothetical protein
MADDIAGWEVISKQGDKFTFWQMVLGLFLGAPPHSMFRFTVRQKSTGYIKTVTAYDESELPERIAKGSFDYARIISDDAAELILTGIRNGGEARSIAFDSVEHIFRHRLKKGDIDPHELFTSLQDFLRPAGEDAVQQFTRRCFPLLAQPRRGKDNDV